MATGTFYPDPNVESTSVDGYLVSSGANATWATKRDGAGSSADDSATSARVILTAGTNTDRWTMLDRMVCGFNLDSLLGNTISAISFWAKVTGSGIQDNLAQDIGVTGGVPASETALVAGDYDNFASTEFATRKDLGALTNNTYYEWVGNAAMIAAAQAAVDAQTNFWAWLRGSSDLDNTPPAWSSGATSDVRFHTAENASGTAQAPKVIVTYSASSSGIIPVLAGQGYFG